ncbi:hypothetical protein [Paraburkholderia caffeinilytica]|uniref:hypothetical protein n=1 Tax=Paraburkholderia caffeinilytica TaxID=1761016 RepID=UPI0013BE954B|nr:hypothetical protein [Paraburkholderia caffeinilytica]
MIGLFFRGAAVLARRELARLFIGELDRAQQFLLKSTSFLKKLRATPTSVCLWRSIVNRAPLDERGGNRQIQPTATAPHLDSTELSRSPSRPTWDIQLIGLDRRLLMSGVATKHAFHSNVQLLLSTASLAANPAKTDASRY